MSEIDRPSLGVYDERAKDYAAMNEQSPYNALYERPAVIELLGEVAGKHVLDAGCGSGPLAQWLVENGASVVGVDVSEAMLEIARERGLSNATFHVADLGKPLGLLANDSFQMAVSSLVLHYLRDWEVPLSELHRVLVPGGSLVVSTHHPAWDIQLSTTGSYFDTELLSDRWPMGEHEVAVRFWRRPLTGMFAAFAAAGFAVETMKEPMPLDECRTRFPDEWEFLTTQPNFVFFRLKAIG